MENIPTLLQNRLAKCPIRERALLARRLDNLRRRLRDGRPVDRGLEELTAELDAAAARLRERRAARARADEREQRVLVERDEIDRSRYTVVSRNVGQYANWTTNAPYLPAHAGI